MSFTDQIKGQVAGFGMDRALGYLKKDPERNIPRLMEFVDRFCPEDLFVEQRYAVRRSIANRDNWYDLIMRLYELDPHVRDTFFRTFLVNANFVGWPQQERMRQEHGCNIPWAVLLDPTSACNLRCTGCWAAEYGHRLSLDIETIDDIIRQGEELGCYFYIYTGGEPLVRKGDLMELCERHPEASFMCFTNGTLIDEAFCERLLAVGNFIPVLSVEGDRDATDARRGTGTYDKVVRAMGLLREARLPFGISACVTSANEEAICSEDYFRQMIDWGALFCWFFTFMPVGVGATAELVPSAAQREHMFRFIRGQRTKLPLFTMDFWGDSEYVGGCIAGGRRYLHINAAGDVEPCVFAHYSNANIHDTTLLDALRSPLFMAYHDGQPFNENLLKPCPILDNPGRLATMVDAAGARSTDLETPEDARALCDKCVQEALEWAPVADELWKACKVEKQARVERRARDLAAMYAAREK
ncbi:MAG: radical SAM protein [Coriobacteriia bacterium]|nr:radical SAM protein [Coriobacteriia bacterium]MBS5477608.1 radical SAM protein [Coriobacteriia bacterium]